MFPSKINTPIDFNAYLNWRSSQVSSAQSDIDAGSNGILTAHNLPQPAVPLDSSSVHGDHESNAPSTGNSESSAPYPKSFSDIIELITNGGDIPGVKQIPETVLEGQASNPTTAKRRKPWETDVASEKVEDIANGDPL